MIRMTLDNESITLVTFYVMFYSNSMARPELGPLNGDFMLAPGFEPMTSDSCLTGAFISGQLLFPYW